MVIPLAFSSPADGQVVFFNLDHQLRIGWTPAQAMDTDGFDTVPPKPVTFITPGTNSMSELRLISRATCYPIPAKEAVTLEVELMNPAALAIDVFSIQGQKKTGIRQVALGKFQYRLDISGYPSGIYYINLAVGSESGPGLIKTLKMIRE
ncbi:MAG: T9SS type A sorting domain-containing protein [Bacteroidales bacterium]